MCFRALVLPYEVWGWPESSLMMGKSFLSPAACSLHQEPGGHSPAWVPVTLGPSVTVRAHPTPVSGSSRKEAIRIAQLETSMSSQRSLAVSQSGNLTSHLPFSFQTQLSLHFTFLAFPHPLPTAWLQEASVDAATPGPTS